MNVYKPRYYWHRGKGYEHRVKEVPYTRKMQPSETDGQERTEGDVQEVNESVGGEACGHSETTAKRVGK